MKLSKLHEDGHWRVFKPHPGGLGGSGRKGKQRISFLTHPEDRGKFVRWGKKPKGRRRS